MENHIAHPTVASPRSATVMPRVRSTARGVLAFLLAGGLLLGAPMPSSADEEPDHDRPEHEQVVDITFPTLPTARFYRDYHDPRGGGTRTHMATDLMGEKLWPLFATVDGTVCRINGVTEPPPSWGMSLSICGDDGRRYAYIHINDDTPGTADMAGDHRYAYAPAVHAGARVRRGQLVAWMGDSGNAKGGTPHLHHEIHDPEVTEPYGQNRIDPYDSLVAALERGDVGGAGMPLRHACPAETEPRRSFTDTAGSVHRTTIDCVSWWDIAHGRSDGTFAPQEPVLRGQMASFLARTLETLGSRLPTEEELDRDGVDFTDTDGHAHRLTIRQLASLGIMDGRPDGGFAPDEALSRIDMAGYVVRAWEHVAERTLPAPRDAFVDDDGHSFERAVDAAAAAQLVAGTGPGRYAPHGPVTRGQMASYLARLIETLAVSGAATPMRRS